MKILVAPLNWGLGHAGRCIPLVHRFIKAGDEVVLAGDGDALLLLEQHFPSLRTIPLASLSLRYGSGKSQVLAMARALPKLVRFAIEDHRLLARLLAVEHFDWVLSDNRFGLYASGVHSVYMTHQLVIPFPRFLRCLEPLAARLHRWVYAHYDEVWIPDDVSDRWSGRLAHTTSPSHSPSHFPAPSPHRSATDSRLRYIGILSRFECTVPAPLSESYDVVAVLSGLEPQRTMLEQQLVARYQARQERVLIVQGKPTQSYDHQVGNIRFLSTMEDAPLMSALLSAKTIICRSGYSGIMDLAYLNRLDCAQLYPTPGQPEQEYLYQYLVEQKRISPVAEG